jgi:class 3 adenylate cyclase/predicted ATPase
MQCPRCQQDVPPDAQFCPACGARLAPVCAQCGTTNAPGHKFCKQCGQSLVTFPQESIGEPREAPAAEAERRQISVMFCDLVGATALSERLDPEDMREIVRTYQEVCGEVIGRFEGHVAQYLGDGVLVYFGHPVAHEDDAQRAVRSGLGIVWGLEKLNARLSSERDLRLAVRVGIHTGLVVVGQMGGGGKYEQLALGETPNLAARLQVLAEPDTVVISEATHRLTHGFFACRDLGMHTLKGVSVPMRAYRVLGEGPAQSRLEVTAATGLTPLVGREQEVGLLLGRWEQVQDGLGQAVLLTGEAGIGKSRLVEVLKEHVTQTPHARWECRCSPYYRDSALHPVIDLYQRALRLTREESSEGKLAKIERGLAEYGLATHEAIMLWASLLSVPLPDRYPALALTPQRQKQKTLEAILALLLALAARQPLLLVVEDLHWVDPSTLELLTLILDQVPTSSVMALFTCRPDFDPPWALRAHLTPLTVTRLTRKQTELLVARVAAAKVLPLEVLEQIVAKTDGVPLFVEELTKMVLESGLLRERDGRYELTGPLPALAIPATLQDSLMARLDRLATVKDVAQLGATLGRSFSYELLRAVSPMEEPTLQKTLRRLVEAELLYQRGIPPQATFIFKHALIQEAAYQSLLKSRRQQFHQRIAQVLLEHFPETPETQPELLAHHYTEAGLLEDAIRYWQRAGERAFKRGANAEAIAHLNKGLAMLNDLPDGPERVGREFDLQAARGAVLMTTKGYAAPEVEQTYLRSLELARQTGNPSQLFAAEWGLFWFSMLRAEVRNCRPVGEELVRMAENAGDPGLLVQAHNSRGQNLYYLGDLPAARHHLERAIAICDAREHRAHDIRRGQLTKVIANREHAALVLWCLGYPAQALERSRQALALAQTEAQPLGRAYALGFATQLHQLRHEGPAAQVQAEAMMALSREHGLTFWLAMATFRLGAAFALQGRLEDGIAKMREGLDAWRATGAELERPYRLAVLAQAYRRLGQAEAARGVLEEAFTAVNATGEAVWEAELHRLKAESLLAQADEDEAEASLLQAIVVARGQQAKSLELRSATSLGRLWQQQGKPEDARRIVSAVYGWFTEGLDTKDLQEAKALLDQLS